MTAPALDSHVSSVTVYRRGARVVRVADITRDGTEFPNHVRVSGLPLCIDDGSVRARIIALDDTAAAPIAADLRVVLESPAVDASLPSADDAAVEEAAREVARWQAQLVQLERELGQLTALTTPRRPDGAEGEPPIASPAASRLAMVSFAIARARTVNDELATSRKALASAERELEKLHELDRRHAGARQVRSNELRKTVVIGLRDRTVGERARIELEYSVPGARWAPAYSVRLDAKMQVASLAMRAVVAQHTGEDWTNAALTLSTAEPSTWTELPELTSRRIGRRQPSLAKAGWRSPPVGADALYADYDRVFASPQVPEPEPIPSFAVPAGAVDRNVSADYAASPLEEVMDFDEGEQLLESLADDSFAGTAEETYSPAPVAAQAAPSRRGRAEKAALPKKLARKSRMLAFGAGGADSFGPPASAPMSGSMPHAPFEAPGGGRAFAPDSPDTREVRARDELLGYGALRMAAADYSGRGVLARSSDAERYLELLVATKVSVSVDVLTVIAASHRLAENLGGLHYPIGHRAEWTGHYDYAYVAEHVVDVPSGDGYHSIPLATHDTTSELLYISVPRESSDVFRTAEIANPMDSPLLAGPVDVYVGDAFLLSSELEFTTPRSGFVLGLGVEQGIKLARNSRFREETSGLLGGALELQHHIHVELQNRLDRAVEVEVRDRLPVTRKDEEDVEVVINKVAPAWDDYEPLVADRGGSALLGGHRWRVNVPAGGTQDLRAAYTVELPSKLELVGGNRRED